MSSTEIQIWLRESIEAIQSGESDKARDLLLRVLQEDDRNEQAWLWLSGVAESDKERRICLENVLTINPENKAALAGIKKLGHSEISVVPPEGTDNTFERHAVRRQKSAVSLASAVLYPDKQGQELSWAEPEVDIRRKGYDTPIKARSKFEDVWTREGDICAFCAYELDFQDETCPQCRRKLIHKAFRYEVPSRSLYVLFVLLINQSQLFLVQAIYDVLQNKAIIVSNIGLPLFFAILFLAIAVGVYNRQDWAYYVTILSTFLILFTVITSILTPVDFRALQLPVRDPAVDNFLDSFGNLISTIIRLLQILITAIAFFYALLVVSPDFVRDEKRLTAVLSKGLKAPTQFHAKAKELAKQGMWATAVLHWQHAAGKEPHTITYQRHLGLAYAQLGFYERSLDILHSALDLSTHPTVQKELQKLIQTVESMHRSP